MPGTNFTHPPLHHILYRSGKTAHRAAHEGAVIDHIVDGAGVNLRHTDHQVLHRVMIAADDGLKGLGDRHSGRDGINGQMRHGPMSALTRDVHFKCIHRRHNRTWRCAQLSCWRARLAMERINSFDGKTLYNSLLHHNLTAATVFLGRLKN